MIYGQSLHPNNQDVMPDADETGSFLGGVTRDSDALYEHLTKVLLKIVKEKPDSALDAFESISVKVKQEAAGVATTSPDDAKVLHASNRLKHTHT